MKAITLYKFLYIILILGFMSPGYAYELKSKSEKKITKSVDTGSEPDIHLNSQKGNITFQTWDQNKVEVEIIITSEADTKAEADKGLEGVDVEVEKKGNAVHISTLFLEEKENKSFWSTVKFWSESLKLTVDMVIKVPPASTFQLHHRYGDMVLPSIGEANIELKYGQLTCNDIHQKLSLDLGYGKANINDINACHAVVKYSDFSADNIKTGNVEIAYSKFDTKGNDKIIMDSKYSKIYLNNINQLDLNGKFDKVEINEIRKVKINTKYTSVGIEKLMNAADIVNSYQSVRIHSLAPNFESLSIENKYGNCEVNLSAALNSQIYCTTKYGNINFPSYIKIEEDTEEDKSKIVKGQIGHSQSKITIHNSFGNINLND